MASRQEVQAARGPGSRARLIQAASDLLRQQGYAATGVKEIARLGAAPVGSFYFHFPGGKEQLAAEAMQHGAAEFCDVLNQALTSNDDLGACYARTATLIAERLDTSAWTFGCPVATTALETIGSSPALQAAARSAFTAWRDALAQRARRAGLATPDAEALASNALALLEGAELLARVERSTAPLTHAATALQTLAQTADKSAVPTPGRRSG